MDIREYESLISKAKKEVEDAREGAERGIKRAQVEKRLAVIQSQLSGVEQIVDDLQKLNREPSDYVTAALVNLKKEEQLALVELEELGDAPFYQEPKKNDVQYAEFVLESPLKEEMLALIQEGRTAKLHELSSDIRRLTFDVWALRWRIACDKIGQENVARCREMQTCYAVIKTAMNENPGERHHIAALKREVSGDWEAQLKQAKSKINGMRESELRFQAALSQLQTLKMLKLDEKSDAEDIRRYKHLVRTVAGNDALRDDLMVICAPYRTLLEEEFAFLWKDQAADEAVPETKDRLTNREILARLLRRMISKTLIGACHGPLDRVCTGFPEHDKGRAREIMNLMIRVGAIRAKKNESEMRVSIEPPYLGNCENFVKGQPFGQKAIDVWAQQDTAVAASK